MVINRNRENYIVHVMNKGFNRAAEAFSKFMNVPVKMMTSQSVLIRHDDDFAYVSEEEGNLYVLTTQIIGEFAGKSYLILNQDESEEIFRAAKSRKEDLSLELKEALLQEIDNIISASVIAELSNSLNVEIYGDVPMLKKMSAKELQDFISHPAEAGEPASVIFSNTSFQFNNREHINPQFIWRLSVKVFDIIPAEKITV